MFIQMEIKMKDKQRERKREREREGGGEADVFEACNYQKEIDSVKKYQWHSDSCIYLEADEFFVDRLFSPA